MDYADIKQLREALTEELKQEIAPLSFTTEHRMLVEQRIQTVLLARRVEAMTAPRDIDDLPVVQDMGVVISRIHSSADRMRDSKKKS